MPAGGGGGELKNYWKGFVFQSINVALCFSILGRFWTRMVLLSVLRIFNFANKGDNWDGTDFTMGVVTRCSECGEWGF